MSDKEIVLRNRFCEHPDPEKAVRYFLKRYEPRLQAMIGAEDQTRHFIETAVLAFLGNEDLQQCTSLSVLSSVHHAASLRLTVGGTAGLCFIVPYKSKSGAAAQFQMGYKGYPALANRHGALIRAQFVTRWDEFSYELGEPPSVRHRIGEGRPENIEWEDITHSWASIRYPNTFLDLEVLDRAKLARHRRCSQSVRFEKKGTPWFTHPDEMSRKSAIHPLGKRSGVMDLVTAASLDERASLNIRQPIERVVAQVLEIPSEQIEAQEKMTANGDGDDERPSDSPIEPPRAKGQEYPDGSWRGDVIHCAHCNEPHKEKHGLAMVSEPDESGRFLTTCEKCGKKFGVPRKD